MSNPRQLDRSGRLDAILVRDGPLVPRAKGGPSWIENEVAACGRCNGQRGHATPIDWLDECVRRGWTPNRDALQSVLDGLRQAIAVKGGQRRAAKYLDSQLRRWSNRAGC